VLSHLNFSYQQRIFMTPNWKNFMKKKYPMPKSVSIEF
jgi:hypothetical protein